MIRFYW